MTVYQAKSSNLEVELPLLMDFKFLYLFRDLF